MPAESLIDDAVDRILVAELSTLVDSTGLAPRRVVVVDDLTGALSVNLRDLLGPEVDLRRSHDSLIADRSVGTVLDERRLQVESVAPGPETFRGADLVLLRLPRSLDALDELAADIADQADPGVRVFAGGREKHLSRGMNSVLARHFDQVSASRGQQKCRVLRASEPRPQNADPTIAATRLPDFDLTVCSVGGTFAGTGVDLGTRILLGRQAEWPARARTVVDLGCGTGLLAAAAARHLPDAQITAVDESWSAVRSTRATAEANGLADRIAVEQADALQTIADQSVDLILCNPPFHRGGARDSSVAFAMIEDAGRVLRPGGELWLVYNAHLPYLPALRRVGSTAIVARDRHYIVTRTTRPAQPTRMLQPAATA